MALQIDEDVQRRLDAIDDNEWEKIVLKLTRYALSKLRQRYWNTPDGCAPGGVDAEDLAMSAIESICSGRRTWHPDEHPDLLVVLKGIVKSEISNLVNARENTHRRVPSATEQERRDGVPEVADRAPNPEDQLALDQDAVEQARLLRLVRESVHGEDELALVLEEILDGKKPREIAMEYGLTATEVYRMTRTIKRRAQSHLKKAGAKTD